MPRYYGVSSGNQARRRYASHPAHPASHTNAEATATETVRNGCQPSVPPTSPAFGTVPPVDVFPDEDFADEEAALGVGDFDWGVFEDEEAAAFATVSTFVFKLSVGGSGTTESSMGMFALPS